MAGRRLGVEQAHLVVVGVADRGHALALGRAGTVELDVEAQAFARVGDLHRPGDAVVVDVAAHEVGRLGDDEVDVGSSARTCSVMQERRLDQLAQLAVARTARCRRPGTGPRTRRSAASSQAQPTLSASAKVLYSQAGSIIRSIFVADPLADGVDVGDSCAIGRVAPAVDLEGRVAHLLALLREVGERLRAGQPAGGGRRGRCWRRRAGGPS